MPIMSKLNDQRLEYNALSYIAHKMGDQELSDLYLELAKALEQVIERNEKLQEEND